MKTVTLEKLGVTLSRLGFGAMRLPQKDGVIDQAHVNEMVKYAFDHGINYYDTAYVYHGQKGEAALGEALKQLPRDKFFVADKMPFIYPDKPGYLDEYFAESCRRLGVDVIDFYLLHALDWTKYDKVKKYDSVNWMKKMKAEGKIRYMGFSIHESADLVEELLNQADWDFVQIQLNYIDEEDRPGKAGYDMLRAKNIPVMIMEPLKGGILSDIGSDIYAPFTALGGEPISYAFRWVNDHPGLGVILSGMSNMDQLRMNISIFDDIKPLNDADRAAVEQVRKNIHATQKVGCTGCRYCMPCPFGVDIPGNFKAWNNKSMQKNANWISSAAINYAQLEQCVGCGRCASLCPQGIDIPGKIRQILAEKK